MLKNIIVLLTYFYLAEKEDIKILKRDIKISKEDITILRPINFGKLMFKV